MQRRESHHDVFKLTFSLLLMLRVVPLASAACTYLGVHDNADANAIPCCN